MAVFAIIAALALLASLSTAEGMRSAMTFVGCTALLLGKLGFFFGMLFVLLTALGGW